MLNQHQIETIIGVYRSETEGISLHKIGLVLLISLLVFIPGVIRIIREKSTFKEVFMAYWLVAYAGIMFYITILRREPGYASGEINPFPTWENFGGNGYKTVFSIYNVLLFIPWGFLLRLYKHRSKRMKAFLYTMVVGFCTTCFIETTQLLTSRGNFEYTDIINNFTGCFIGEVLGALFLTVFWKHAGKHEIKG